MILTTPVIHALREKWPEAELTLVADASARSLAGNIDVDQCWLVERGAIAKGLLGIGPCAWVKKLAFGKYDFCLDFTGTDRSLFLALLSGSQKRITYARFQKKFLRTAVYTDFVESSVRDRHTADHHTDLLRPLGLAIDNVPLDLRIDPVTAEHAAQVLAKAGVTAPFAVIHAGTARPEKYWQPERWAQVAEELHTRHGLHCVLTGSRDADEQAHLSTIKKRAKSPLIDLSGQTNLLELASVIRSAALFCGVDTAAMHLADAMRTPTVALFGPTNPYHWRPRHTKNIVLRVNTSEPFTPAQKGGHMDQMTVGTVLDAVGELVGASA